MQGRNYYTCSRFCGAWKIKPKYGAPLPLTILGNEMKSRANNKNKNKNKQQPNNLQSKNQKQNKKQTKKSQLITIRKTNQAYR